MTLTQKQKQYLYSKENLKKLKPFRKGHTLWTKGNSPSQRPEVAKKISETFKRLYAEGKMIPWNKNRKNCFSRETIKKMSETRKNLIKEGKIHSVFKVGNKYGQLTKGKHKVEIPWWIKRGLEKPRIFSKLKPTKLELKLNRLLQVNLPNEFKYVGNGEFILGSKNPDFLNINGKKQVIEVFGNYWHTQKDMPYHQTEQGCKEYYKQYGFDCLIVWEKELNLSEEQIINKIKVFLNGYS